ncbi:MAG: PH domain-containing protein [[Clostridium] nexile]
MTSIKKTWNPLSSAASSLRRIQIDYGKQTA